MECFRTSKYGQKLPNYRFSSKNSIIMRAHSLVMALYQDQNMSESSMGHYFENARFRRRQGQSRTLKMQFKLTQTQVFYKKKHLQQRPIASLWAHIKTKICHRNQGGISFKNGPSMRRQWWSKPPKCS